MASCRSVRFVSIARPDNNRTVVRFKNTMRLPRVVASHPASTNFSKQLYLSKNLSYASALDKRIGQRFIGHRSLSDSLTNMSRQPARNRLVAFAIG